MPKDSIDYGRLVDSSNLMLFGYPLDRSLTDEEVEFFENDTTDTFGYPWQYTKVPTDYVFPEDLIHEVLDEVVVETYTEDDINKGTAANKISASTWDRITNRTLRIPENARASYKWTPFAKITYVDDLTNQTIPLVGVKVRCHHLLHFSESYTDTNGEAKRFDTFKKDVRYKILWEDPNFWDIRDGYIGQAKTKGPQYSAPWLLTISGDTRDAMYAAIHRGCRAVFYDNPFGITRPYAANRVKLCAFFINEDDVDGDYAGFAETFWPDIRIFRNNKGRRTRWQMTSTTIHELGHCSHHRAVVNLPGSNRLRDFVFASEKLKETWARGVQFAHMSWLYPNQVDKIRPGYFKDYTGIIEGLLNQGLTLKQLENTVVGTQLWREWRPKIKSLGLIDDVIVDMIFDNPYLFWTENFKNLIIGTSQIYTGMDVTYSLPKFEDNRINIIISNWTISGSGYTILQDDRGNRSIKVRFNTLGERTLTAQIKLLDGTIYAVNKKINVTSRGNIFGRTTPVIGLLHTYTLTGYSGTVDKWVFEGITSQHYWIESSTSNSVRVVFKRPCTATIKATIQNDELAVKSVTIPNDAPISAYIAMKNQDFPNDFYLYLSFKEYDVIPSALVKKGSRYPEPKESKMHFMAYASRPSASHPHYSLLKPIYENGYYHKKYAYDGHIYPEFPQYGAKAWIFSTKQAGTVPLYLVTYQKVDDENIVHAIRYLTTENVSSWKTVTSWHWNWLGTKKTGDRDWTSQTNAGIQGYVYPYRPQDYLYSIYKTPTAE